MNDSTPFRARFIHLTHRLRLVRGGGRCGAIGMAQDVMNRGDDANVRGPADSIIAAQQAEMTQMTGLLD